MTILVFVSAKLCVEINKTMTLQEVKDWVNSLPEEFLEFETTVSECGTLNEDFSYRKDIPIQSLAVDEETEEVLIIIPTQ